MAIALVGKKLGMTRLMANDGSASSVSVIKIEPNRVVQSKSVDTDGYNAIQVTTGKKTNKKGDAKIRRVSSSLKGHYAKASQEIGLGLWEMRVSENEVSDMPNLDVSYFGAGHYVNVTGKSKGKGFQGGVKRHNFSMQDATHGNSVSHRAIGSTGQCQDPGRVFKGKKMAGQMGNAQVTEECLEILRVDSERNLLISHNNQATGDIDVRPIPEGLSRLMGPAPPGCESPCLAPCRNRSLALGDCRYAGRAGAGGDCRAGTGSTADRYGLRVVLRASGPGRARSAQAGVRQP